MKGKVLGIFLGIVLGAVAIMIVIFVLSRPGAVPQVETETKAVTADDLKAIKDKTSALENYGNLPVVVTGDQISRDNPFASY